MPRRLSNGAVSMKKLDDGRRRSVEKNFSCCALWRSTGRGGRLCRPTAIGVRVRTNVGAGGAGRIWSLRREWSRAFSIMLGLLLLAAVATVIGVSGLVNQVDGTARQLRHESAASESLQSALVAHEEVAHKLLSNEPVNRAAFVQEQHEISRQFDTAVAVFPVTEGMRATVVEAQRSWQQGLTTYGLWGDQVAALHGDHSDNNPTFGASSDQTVALLAGLEGPSLVALDHGLARGADLERILIAALAGLFGLAFAVTVYFRRRMGQDLFRPVASMHEGVLKLQDGDFHFRIDVARRDELGELTEAFNGMAGALRDSHQALTLRATRDSLTGLPNRASLTERLTASFHPGADRRSQQESVLFVDVDDFKEVNDSLGHEGGDALLIQLAARLSACVRPYDLVARLGGDEFAIVVVEEDGATTASEVAERILDALRTPFSVGGIGLTVSVSIGVAQRRAEIRDAAELLRHADFAMYMAKGSGKGQYQIFDTRVHDNIVGRSALKTDLAGAVAAGQLRLDYQPVADLRTGDVLGVEALVRWQHPTLGLLNPAEFVALAEETGDIDAVGGWVLDTATRQASAWRHSMDHCADLWLSVNLSPFQLANPDGVIAIEQILADPTVQADHVVLEITERALTSDIEASIATLNALKRFGVRIAIDDFGSGFTSLSTLARLRVDLLKIDPSFVSDQTSGPPSAPMLEGILGLADRLSLTVIAKGIEQPRQLDLLRTLGCTQGQGYLLGRPTPAIEFEALLASGGLLHLSQRGT
jgi:diguanylate cyclase (GGDEF)-like protein